MKVNFLTSFSAGILLTTSICSAVYFSGNHETAKQVKVQLSENEMKDKLVSSGYIVEKKAAADKNSETESKKSDFDQKKVSTPQQTAPAEKKPAVTQVTVNVQTGMTSFDVGRVLVNAKLVQDAFKFSKAIEARGLQNKLRPGTYVVNSGMSFNEIVSTIFK